MFPLLVIPLSLSTKKKYSIDRKVCIIIFDVLFPSTVVLMLAADNDYDDVDAYVEKFTYNSLHFNADERDASLCLTADSVITF